MGSGVSILDAEIAARQEDLFCFDEACKDSNRDNKKSRSTIDMTKSSQAIFFENLKKRTEHFLKQYLTAQTNVNEIQYFLSDPTSMQLYKQYLKDKSETPEALTLYEVNCSWVLYKVLYFPRTDDVACYYRT
jgi:hypothetical protein